MNIETGKPQKPEIPKVLYIKRPRLSMLRISTLSMKEVPLSTSETCNKAFIQLRHSTMEKEKDPHRLRVQIIHNFLCSRSNYMPETSQHAPTLQLKPGTPT